MGKHRVIRVGDDRYDVALDNPPPNSVPLEMASERIEDDLRSGQWLFLLFAVWSVPDIGQIDRALEFER